MITNGVYEQKTRDIPRLFQPKVFWWNPRMMSIFQKQSSCYLAPADAVSFGATDTINFSWDPVLDADTYSFQIAIPSFENATEIIKNETTVATTFSVSNLAVNSYEWRVRALNPTFQTSYTTQKFTVE